MIKKLFLSIVLLLSVMFLDINGVKAYWKVENYNYDYNLSNCSQGDLNRTFCLEGYTNNVMNCLKEQVTNMFKYGDEDYLNYYHRYQDEYINNTSMVRPASRGSGWTYVWNINNLSNTGSNLKRCYRTAKATNDDSITTCSIPQNISILSPTGDSAGKCGPNQFEYNSRCYKCENSPSSGIENPDDGRGGSLEPGGVKYPASPIVYDDCSCVIDTNAKPIPVCKNYKYDSKKMACYSLDIFGNPHNYNNIAVIKNGFNNYFLDYDKENLGNNKKCKSGYYLVGSICYKKVCNEGYIQSGESCFKCSEYKCDGKNYTGTSPAKPEEDYGRADCSVFKGITGPLWAAIRLIAPVLALVMGAVDFLKAVAASDEKAMNKAGNDFAKRLAMVAVLFILTYVVSLIVGLIGYGGAGSCL